VRDQRFAGVGEQTLALLRQLRQHNDVIALQVYDPIALQLPDKGRLSVTQGAEQVEMDIGRSQVRRPLGDYLAGRLREVAELLRRSQVPLLMISTGDDSLEQLRKELGRLAGGRDEQACGRPATELAPGRRRSATCRRPGPGSCCWGCCWPAC
jgi:hypothetical protein